MKDYQEHIGAQVAREPIRFSHEQEGQCDGPPENVCEAESEHGEKAQCSSVGRIGYEAIE